MPNELIAARLFSRSHDSLLRFSEWVQDKPGECLFKVVDWADVHQWDEQGNLTVYKPHFEIAFGDEETAALAERTFPEFSRTPPIIVTRQRPVEAHAR